MVKRVFYPKEEFLKESINYTLLPFRFKRHLDGSYLLVNEVGEYHLLEQVDFDKLVKHELSPLTKVYKSLKSKHFLVDEHSSALFDVLAAKYRTKKSFLDGFVKLHIFVPTLRCNQSCQYCQVTRQNSFATNFDMTVETIHKSVDLMLACPSPSITMEFQGGEPLLNFDVVKEGVLYTKKQNAGIGKDISYVICTNLTLLEDRHIDFFKEHNIQVSSSLDGPAKLHNINRPLSGEDSHKIVTRNIRRIQEAIGYDAVSCLMTTTKHSLKYAHEIVDEYLRMNIHSIFIRDLNPYGYAVKTQKSIGYSVIEFLDFFKRILSYIIEINKKGITFCESYTALLLTKILTPWPVGFVDLQTPCGAGFGTVVYNYDGNVYASDEARMLAEMGSDAFRLGNVFQDSYNNIFFGETMQKIASVACNEALPGCSDCVYQTFCGSDPIRNHATQNDMVGHRPTSSFCKKNMGMIQYIFDLLLSNDKDLEKIFWAWINREDINNMKLSEPVWASK